MPGKFIFSIMADLSTAKKITPGIFLENGVIRLQNSGSGGNGCLNCDIFFQGIEWCQVGCMITQ